MIAVQHLLSFARPLAARVRSVRRPFRPAAGEGAYRLPHDVRDRLTAALAPFRNRGSAFALAAFLARVWWGPGRRGGVGFPPAACRAGPPRGGSGALPQSGERLCPGDLPGPVLVGSWSGRGV